MSSAFSHPVSLTLSWPRALHFLTFYWTHSPLIIILILPLEFIVCSSNPSSPKRGDIYKPALGDTVYKWAFHTEFWSHLIAHRECGKSVEKIVEMLLYISKSIKKEKKKKEKNEQKKQICFQVGKKNRQQWDAWRTNGYFCSRLFLYKFLWENDPSNFTSLLSKEISRMSQTVLRFVKVCNQKSSIRIHLKTHFSSKIKLYIQINFIALICVYFYFRRKIWDNVLNQTYS